MAQRFLIIAAIAPLLVGARWGGVNAAEGIMVVGAQVAPDTVVHRNLVAPRAFPPLGTDGRPITSGLMGRPIAPDRPVLRLGLLPLVIPPIDVAPPPGLDDPFIRPVREIALDWRGRLGRDPASDDFLRVAATLLHEAPSSVEVIAVASAPGVPSAVPDDTTTTQIESLLNEYADLDVRVGARTEIQGDWSRFRPCESELQESCSPGLLPQFRPDLTFDVDVSGTISDRIHVDVDFDQAREFEATNRINMFYEGAPDDIIQRLEIGDVTFALPPSRFLTQGLPAGNFGFQARGQMGPIDFRAVWAEQKGDLSSRVFRLEGVGNQRRFVQEDTVVWDDADYVKGQFFFLVDPREIDRYPHIDVLSLDLASASSSVAPGAEPVQLYRFEANPIARQQVEGFIQADASLERDGETVIESGWFRYMQPGEDYFVHPSGLWVALRNPLSRDEMLAVTYVTASGETIGDYNPEVLYASGERPQLRLLKGSRRTHQPGQPTWDFEMRNVYRISASDDVELPTVQVDVSVGELSAGRTFVRSRTGEDITFLRLLGLDREAPTDVVDQAALYSPARDVFTERPPVRGTFLIFPTLEPFGAPPPLVELGLDDDDTLELLGEEANRTIYDNPDPFERDNGGLFRLTVPFRVRSEGVISSFSLGAFGIRDESERIFLGDRALVRGVDYEIDYTIGQVVLLNAETLFSAQPDAEIRATWEQQQLFQSAPVSVFGLATQARLGTKGAINLIGLYRNEKTLITRPTLGLEPGSVGLAGLSGRYESGVDWLDRALTAVPGLRFAEPSVFRVEGEGALSLPNPNTRGAVFVDDFDASSERPLSLLSWDWTRGSAPTIRDGAEDVLPLNLDASSLADLVWQHTWILEGIGGDSIGVQEGFLPREDIDQQIRVAGSQLREPGLRLTVRPRESGVGPRWASITTTLSQRGTDLTKSEFIEFYVAGGQNQSLILDLGVVAEDAFFVADDGATSGIKETGVPWGLDRLDQEADPGLGEIWGNEADRRGVWGESCQAEVGRIYRLGDVRAVCTRGNGRQDSEDLDGDGNLGTAEKHLRYVIRLDGTSPFLARTKDETGTDFQLYRIPIETVEAIQAGGPFTEADLRSVKHLRVTVAGPGSAGITIARPRIIGSTWIKRGDDGVLSGIAGDTLALSGRVEVTPVSRLTEGDAYSSPPGVLEELSDPTIAFGGQGVEFSEKSLAVRFENLASGDRAEVYNRFPQRPRDFLRYREARLWVTARSGDFFGSEPRYFFVKVGTDSDNFYLYRSLLNPPPAGGVVKPGDWLPEAIIDFDEWLALRRVAEERLIREPPGPGSPPIQIWSSDSTYAVVLRDRGQAPDLANVREVSLGIWNLGEESADGEIWVDELRLSRPVRDAALSSYVSVELNAADVLETRLTWSRRGAFFQQLDEDPTYQTDELVSLNSQLRLERFLPADWGVEVPVNFSLDDATQDPTFLADSDVRGNQITGLRSIGTRRSRLSVGFRKRSPSANPVISALLDGLEANVAWFRSHTGTITSRLESDGLDARFGYDRRLDRRTIGVVPGFLEGAVRFLLPRFLEDDVVDARLRWTPERVSFGTGYLRTDADIFRFDQITSEPSDTLVEATRAPRESLESVAEISFQPFGPITADVTMLTTRELLEPGELASDTVVQDLLRQERSDLVGLDLGWETRRVVRTRFGFAPSFVPWLRHELGWDTHYLSDRNATFVGEDVTEATADTTRFLERSASGERNLRADFSWDVAAMSRSFLEGGSDPLEGASLGADAEALSSSAQVRTPLILRILGALRPTTLSVTDGLTSRFNRDRVGPGFGYQFGLVSEDDFRFQEQDTASTLVDRTVWRAGSGVVLPRGLELDVAYTVGDVGTLDTRSDRFLRTETWPDLSLRADVGGIPKTPIDRLSISAGWAHDLRETTFGGGSQQLRRQEDRRLPLDVRMGWSTAANLTYSGSLIDGEGVDPTGDTEREGASHRLAVTSSFLPPGALGEQLDRPISLSLIFSYVEESECRVARFQNSCVAFVDQINRALSLTLGTSVGGFDVGLQSSYTDRQSFIGVRSGSTQFQLGLFGEFVFEGSSRGSGPFR